jgi:hypothetical protein
MHWHALVAAAAAVLPLAAQQTIIVSGGGFALNQAIAAASPGDLLIVRAGNYVPAWSDRGVSILCDPGVIFESAFGPSLGARGIPVGQTFLLRGGTIQFIGHAGGPVVQSCQGAVRFEDLVHNQPPIGAISDSANVSFRNCHLSHVEVRNSTVALHGCNGVGRIFESALLIRSGNVTISGGSFTGGGQAPFSAMPAIVLEAGLVTITGDSNTTIAAAGGTSGSVPAIATTGGTIVLDPSVTLRGNASPAVTGPAFVDVVRVPYASVQLDPSLLRASIFAEPSALSAALLSWSVPPLPTPFGTLWVHALASVVDFGVVPAGGVRTLQLTVPPLASALPIILQPASLGVNGRIVLGAPDLFTTR